MAHWHDVSTQLSGPARSLREAIPDTWAGFVGLHREAFKEGALSPAIKEIIGLVCAVVDECDGCIASHARGAARKGATKEQVAEALGVVVAMRGGPGTVWGPRAWEAFLEYSEPQEA